MPIRQIALLFAFFVGASNFDTALQAQTVSYGGVIVNDPPHAMFPVVTPVTGTVFAAVPNGTVIAFSVLMTNTTHGTSEPNTINLTFNGGQATLAMNADCPAGGIGDNGKMVISPITAGYTGSQQLTFTYD